jgi:hypothetical protein
MVAALGPKRIKVILEWWDCAMLPELQYEWRLRQLQRSRRKLIADYKKKRLALPKSKERAEAREKIDLDERIDLEEANEEISFATTSHLVEEAQRLIVPIPPRDNGEYWYIDNTFGRNHLTTAGVIKLRSDIRVERKARRELPLSLLPMAIGLVGALTGLLSVILRSK